MYNNVKASPSQIIQFHELVKHCVVCPHLQFSILRKYLSKAQDNVRYGHQTYLLCPLEVLTKLATAHDYHKFSELTDSMR